MLYDMCLTPSTYNRHIAKQEIAVSPFEDFSWFLHGATVIVVLVLLLGALS